MANGNKGPLSDSFEMDFMMPPDIASIDSDINKINQLTPAAFTDNNFNVMNANNNNNFGNNGMLTHSNFIDDLHSNISGNNMSEFGGARSSNQYPYQ
eukprot:CAMPEP_0176348394 /NCGR_PEP_ID=MMETSP0126-20121128/7826_1 /TAXON_ID=141414 ORGANISM="Strombidinopsis acuminatum, Strain SPMC142" /NCGR_SAMPLE_ID=MMETSP0126 /ASSEMBLY_ACC=CAM_ASM_000229 /LENGTH=96 /DNA_ID=CAMNT_0017697151 /DNA_START=1461 /DNA_END=1751 /DNA_ORIENTATION=+